MDQSDPQYVPYQNLKALEADLVQQLLSVREQQIRIADDYMTRKRTGQTAKAEAPAAGGMNLAK